MSGEQGDKKSFLSLLFEKKASVLKAQSETGVNMSALVAEVERQIKQALEGGDPIKGKGVTKSGGDDGY
jgi:hypothetical protein